MITVVKFQQTIILITSNLDFVDTVHYIPYIIFSQCHAAPQLTVTWLELWRYTNYITYLLTYIECNQRQF